ncbi:Sugar transferase involved in LPS biosynthesis (colanic, teichoic acid) [Devosia lucknowensis]|uniref:Sugar transferase involved in LPS biosynthesis (Colanic, teichoic acid) n=1 Tax=Devosia lucknowensis TaxID=1096929 RepID=A0A1Y6G870_9HYPH|nr:sugar transferase [Devosia lucknowensis]SMQ85533.1 Sugar transferase involved in LPS biosynthesis (colanic, teichoic acid) [Devosia lucknowensis]
MSVRSFVIVGASGTVGRRLIPALIDAGCRVGLIGRDTEKLKGIFPGADVGGYADIGKTGGAGSTLLYLATINNDKDADYEAFKAVNVDLALATRDHAAAAGMERFVYFSSTHALDETNSSAYARSKRAAVELLGQNAPIDTRILYLPAVTGETLSGRLAVLNRLPGLVSRPLLSVLKALKPTVTIPDIVTELIALDDTRDDAPVVSTDQERNPFFVGLKWLMDFVSALAILLLLWWLMIAVWVVIKVQSPGPGIFSQTRIGRHGKPFTCYKFRTMYTSAPNVATHQVPISAVTPLGSFLRKSKVDELPQVFNILANQMSLVGPRPCLPSQTELIAERQARNVLSIKPGITGLAQVNDIDMSDPVRLAKWDQRYLKLRSLLFDIKLIIQTGLGRGRGDKIRPDRA